MKHMLSRLVGAPRADTPQSHRPVSASTDWSARRGRLLHSLTVLTSTPNEALHQLISELSELFADDFIDSAAGFMS